MEADLKPKKPESLELILRIHTAQLLEEVDVLTMEEQSAYFEWLAQTLEIISEKCKRRKNAT